MAVTREVVEAGAAEVLAVEPHIHALPAELESLPGVRLATLDEALEKAAVVVLLVDHQPFRHLDPDRLAGKRVVDTRGIWRRKA